MQCGINGCSTVAACDRCLHDGFMHLKGVAACRADTWADELAMKRRGPWVPWPADSERVRTAAIDRVADLTRDPRLRAKLVDVLIEYAAKRWAENEKGPTWNRRA